MKSRTRQNGFVRSVKKYLLSAFVVVTFTAYALNHRANAGEAVSAPDGATTTAAGTSASTTTASAPAAPAAGVNSTGGVASRSSSGYKDGSYKGPLVDVNWGYVQVQATIQSGKISSVRFLQYPSDRRTSVRINQIADPELEQEAIQAQSANVDIISGATLTSEGFQMSLQNALSQAKS